LRFYGEVKEHITLQMQLLIGHFQSSLAYSLPMHPPKFNDLIRNFHHNYTAFAILTHIRHGIISIPYQLPSLQNILTDAKLAATFDLPYQTISCLNSPPPVLAGLPSKVEIPKQQVHSSTASQQPKYTAVRHVPHASQDEQISFSMTRPLKQWRKGSERASAAARN
jgi:hypothetical protein